MHLKLKRTPALYITGFMGSGKTTVGASLAQRLGWEFVDLDQEIERFHNITIPRLFEERGEPEFRRLEAEMIQKWVRQIECGMPHVVALGGGAFVQPGNCRLMENNGVSVWLDCTYEVVLSRLSRTEDRPLARDPERLRDLFIERRAAYGKADFRVDGDLSTADVVEAIIQLPLWK